MLGAGLDLTIENEKERTQVVINVYKYLKSLKNK